MTTPMDKLVNDAIIEAVATKIIERLQPELRAQWAAAVSEWADTRKTNVTIANRISLLEFAVQKQLVQIEKLTQERQTLKEMSTKAIQILNEAKKELGLP